LYRISASNKDSITDAVNADLAALESWGVEWHVSFRKRSPSKPFDPSGISFMGKPISQVAQI
jgi:hypothetical protein